MGDLEPFPPQFISQDEAATLATRVMGVPVEKRHIQSADLARLQWRRRKYVRRSDVLRWINQQVYLRCDVGGALND